MTRDEYIAHEIADYIRSHIDRRLEAYRLLTTTGLPIKAILSQTGFHSLTSFTRAFHSRYQISPAALRNQR